MNKLKSVPSAKPAEESGQLIRPRASFLSALGDRLVASWHKERPLWALRPLGFLYGLAALARRFYFLKFNPPKKVEVPVISLGNLSVGGTGKTPLCLALAELLLARGYRPAVLSRGYGRRRQRSYPKTLVVSTGQGPRFSAELSGDEPWQLASQLSGLIVAVDTDRYRAARLVIEDLKADVIILDDGFQQLRLAADCRVLLIPAQNSFGNGAVLPTGPLREFLIGHRRADILINTGAIEPTPKTLALAGKRPAFSAEYLPVGWLDWLNLLDGIGEEMEPPEALRGRPVLAFCGLGRPQSFERSLLALGVELRRFIAFPDHQVYSEEILNILDQAFKDSGAEVLVTTVKDAVKLPPDLKWPLKVLDIELALDQPQKFLETIVAKFQSS